MEKPEISEGLRNALERGYSLELAMSSFINAGYTKQDVIDSAKSFGGSFLNTSSQPVIQTQPSQPSQTPVFRPVQATQANPKIQNTQQPQYVNKPMNTQQPQYPLKPQSPQYYPQSEPQPQAIQNQRNIQQNPPTPTPIFPQTNNMNASQAVSVKVKPKKKGFGLVILLVVILIFLLGVLFTLVFAREKILELLASIGLEF
ncbi:MAG: hypothetical protein KKB21_05615 [Nanoarchaeota archaeon]|nr:hypothetical protein [Nanoarchaeota archaeon]MBU4087025.1 hypothetical protein [Nanoarchaeota archaeon]